MEIKSGNTSISWNPFGCPQISRAPLPRAYIETFLSSNSGDDWYLTIHFSNVLARPSGKLHFRGARQYRPLQMTVAAARRAFDAISDPELMVEVLIKFHVLPHFPCSVPPSVRLSPLPNGKDRSKADSMSITNSDALLGKIAGLTSSPDSRFLELGRLLRRCRV